MPEQLCKHITATLPFLQNEVRMTQVYLQLLLLLQQMSRVLRRIVVIKVYKIKEL